MKIYTKTGDLGETSLLGGTRIKKSHLIIKTYGELDELNSYLGLVKQIILSTFYPYPNKSDFINNFDRYQSFIFTLGTRVSGPISENLPTLDISCVQLIESDIDFVQSFLPELKNFILPGGNRDSAMVHIARTVCRRVERTLVEYNLDSFLEPSALVFINRLSDLLFVISRLISNNSETIWVPVYEK